MATSSSGAIPVINEKGERSMQRVKVERYVSGKKPKYAPEDSSSDEDLYDLDEQVESNEDDELKDEEERVLVHDEPLELPDDQDCDDPRLAKLKKIANKQSHTNSSRIRTITRVTPDRDSYQNKSNKDHVIDDDDDSDADIRRRHALARSRKKLAPVSDSIPSKQEERRSDSESSEEESSEESCEEDDSEPRLMPIFIPKSERQAPTKPQDEEKNKKKMVEENRMQTLKMIEEDIRRQQALEPDQGDHEITKTAIESINTDDEEDRELAYEEWKLRELKRIQRDREQKELLKQASEEALKIRKMSDEDRTSYLAKNPKEIVNDTPKGRMKYLQRYYHRGAFYLDEDSNVFKRDFQQPTLEDRLDRTSLPQAMQVKNFGRSGRTKYTHLADQDTTKFDNPWSSINTINKKFYETKAGGLKDYDKK